VLGELHHEIYKSSYNVSNISLFEFTPLAILTMNLKEKAKKEAYALIQLVSDKVTFMTIKPGSSHAQMWRPQIEKHTK
jgi:hypothetical protein